VRRIAHAVNHHDYELDEAVQEAQGQVVLDNMLADEDVLGEDQGHAASPESNQEAVDEELLMDTVLALMEIADQLGGTIESLNNIAQGPVWQDLPEPWGTYAQEAYEKIKVEIEKGVQDVM